MNADKNICVYPKKQVNLKFNLCLSECRSSQNPLQPYFKDHLKNCRALMLPVIFLKSW